MADMPQPLQVYIYSLAKGANYKMSYLKHHQAHRHLSKDLLFLAFLVQPRPS